MNFTCVVCGIVFVIGGLLLAFGRVYAHLDAWKKMSKEEQDSIRIRPLCRNMGLVVALCGLIFFLSGLWWETFMASVFIWAMIVWFILCGLDIFYIIKSGRYMKQPDLMNR